MKAFLEVVALLMVGWIAGAELGSWCCVQPLVETLPYEQQIVLEQGLLDTFGSIMPTLMPLSGILATALAIFSWREGNAVLWLRVAAAICIAITVATTLTVNVPINMRTAQWQLIDDPAEWSRMRAQWHLYQGVRGGLFMAAFVLLAAATPFARNSRAAVGLRS